MKPPFLGTKILENISIDDIEPLIDRKSLFVGRWQFKDGDENVLSIYDRVIARARIQNILVPKAIYGYFECVQDGNALMVKGETDTIRFEFPRERTVPHRCVADFFAQGIIAVQAVTIGSEVARVGSELFARHSYSEMFYLKGLAAEAAEAVAKFCEQKIKAELGSPPSSGARFSPGFPSFPDLFSQRKIARLLFPARIGLKLTKTCQIVPEYSTFAVVSVDPKAGQFHP